MPARRLALPLSLLALLAGCEMLGIESPEKTAAIREGEGKAVGSACRHANRAIEDCYALNPKAPKAAVFAGWREMDEYMRENKIDGVAPALAQSAARPDAGARSSREAGTVKPGGTAAERKPAGADAGKAAAAAHES
jgi:hypothetical protein